MDRRGGSSEVRGGDSSQDALQGTEEKHFHDSDGESGWQGANMQVAYNGAGDGSSGIVITNMGELSDAIKSSNMSQVTRISVDGQAAARGHFGLGMALASCQMSALKELVVRGNVSGAVVNALSLGSFPCLRSIDFGRNVIKPESIEALGNFKHCRELLKEHKVPEICDKIRRRLPIWSETRKKFPVLHWEEFLHEVEKLSGQGHEEMILLATEYFNEAGALMYIESFPTQWGILYRRLVILNPNWFWNELIGSVFLSEDMGNGREGDHVLRNKVNPTTGSISMSDFKSIFKSRCSPEDCDDLIAILLWLGLCYTVKERLCIPSLIDRNAKSGDPWQFQSASAHADREENREQQWVMGFSIEHQKNAKTRAPISLWNKFKDQLAQNPKFGVPDSDFVAVEDFMSFTVDYMNVRIEVDAEKNSPTFDEISIFVKPLFSKDELDINERKQHQVDLADDLVDILLGLWDENGGGVEYVVKVVWPWPVSESWPWPVSQSRPAYNPDRNVDVSKVKKWVGSNGMGREMPWPVGSDSKIKEDQLLSTNHKSSVSREGPQCVTSNGGKVGL